MLNKKGVINMEKLIAKYKKWLATAEHFKSNGVEFADRNIDKDIENYKAIIKMYQNPKFVAELNRVWESA
tara:strand:- start:133 stop:342 length:210 start_codon:yes stop_codon:yes gene_type:complete